MLEINDINLTFHEGTSREVKAIKHVNLAIEKGSFTLLLGSNGSGKSTLLNILAGTLFPNSGTIILDGKQLQTIQAYRRSAYIARVFQNPILGTAPDLTLLDNFRIASLRTQSKGLKIGINAAFRKKVAEHVSILNLGLENRLDQLMGSFSGGQRQALSLLMATFDTLDLLLLDEPTAALDPRFKPCQSHHQRKKPHGHHGHPRTPTLHQSGQSHHPARSRGSYSGYFCYSEVFS